MQYNETIVATEPHQPQQSDELHVDGALVQHDLQEKMRRIETSSVQDSEPSCAYFLAAFNVQRLVRTPRDMSSTIFPI